MYWAAHVSGWAVSLMDRTNLLDPRLQLLTFWAGQHEVDWATLLMGCSTSHGPPVAGSYSRWAGHHFLSRTIQMDESTSRASLAIGHIAPTSPRSQEKSFDEVAGLGTAYIYLGRPAISFSDDEKARLAYPYRYALVGKFSHGVPSWKGLHDGMERLGLKGAFSVGVINFRHVLINCSNDEDYARLWMRQIWTFEGMPMRVLKWSPEFSITEESPIAPWQTAALDEERRDIDNSTPAEMDNDELQAEQIGVENVTLLDDVNRQITVGDHSATITLNKSGLHARGQYTGENLMCVRYAQICRDSRTESAGQNLMAETEQHLMAENVLLADAENEQHVLGKGLSHRFNLMTFKRAKAKAQVVDIRDITQWKSSNKTIFDCGLIDIGFEGSQFTWTNKRIWQQLDRVLFSREWLECFQDTKVSHLPRNTSDHCPIMISTDHITARRPSTFRFQNMWLRHEDFISMVKLAWELPSQMQGLLKLKEKLHRLKQRLGWWNRTKVGDIFQQTKEAESLATEAEINYDRDLTKANLITMNRASARLNRALTLEED
ncbi:UNVERIFIED_CONTAM: hypothetical protein Sangu_2873500 [Sesamum angustifolium]|uniref:DUF4283 domain-containing protein n=1 Tax=Sesamum angustifolium TaxID=2727405 RepID=A0AAW2INM7_9LAMI